MVAKICAYCGEGYDGHFNSRFCKNQHYASCAVCKIEYPVNVKNLSRVSKTCSQSCASSLSHSEASRQKRKENNIKKYGVEHAFQAELVKDKIKKALDENPDKDFRIGGKKFQNLIEDKHGVTNVSQADFVKEKKRQAALEKYGVENIMQSPEVRENLRKSILKKYGVEHASQSEVSREKFSNTLFERYGTLKPNQHKIHDYDNWVNFEEWLKSLDHKVTIDEVARHFNVHYYTVGVRKRKESLSKYFRSSNSKLEDAFKSFLDRDFPDVAYLHNSRSVIAPLELDFYFPEFKFAVEFSPTSSHYSLDEEEFVLSSKDDDMGRRFNKDSDYHVNKALACESIGVELFTFFDWMPWEKSLDMIRHKLSGSSRRVFARKTSAHYVDKSVKSNAAVAKRVKYFIDDVHVLGFDGRGTQFYTYLELDGEIVAAAGWGKPRNLSIKNLGKERPDDVIELTRMCFKAGVSVPGGASRLLKTFLREHSSKVSQILTFSDFDLGSGNIYRTLGFDLVESPMAQLNYVHPYISAAKSNGERNFRIKNTSLHFAGADRLLKSFPAYEPVGLVCVCEDEIHADNSCLPNNTEIVLSYGFLPVFDCGYKKWVLKISESEVK